MWRDENIGFVTAFKSGWNFDNLCDIYLSRDIQDEKAGSVTKSFISLLTKRVNIWLGINIIFQVGQVCKNLSEGNVVTQTQKTHTAENAENHIV